MPALQTRRTTATTTRIVSNLRRLPAEAADCRLELEHVPTRQGIGPILRMHFCSRRCDAVLLHCPSGQEIWLLCLLRWLLPSRARLLCSDLILTKPGTGWWERAKAWVKGVLLKQVDRFLLHQKDFENLEAAYGIAPARCRYVPFKVNSWSTIAQLDPAEGDYLFSGGRSRRDYDTLIAALRELPYPTVIVTPPPSQNAEHGTVIQTQDLPPHIRVLHDDGTPQSFIDFMARSRLVVLPVRPDSISPSGVGVYLMAMALRKCVVITDSSATQGVLENHDQAILVPPLDAAALRTAIRRAWEDDAYRRAIADRARTYAHSLGGEDELLANLAALTVEYLQESAPSLEP